MGSSYFYLEFLLAWLSLLGDAGFKNPAIFALEYSLVPEACYPTQLQQTIEGYKYAVSKAEDSSRVCISGDSAGGTLILSLLLHLARQSEIELPGMAVLISPWVTLAAKQAKNTPSDYLDINSLQLYASQYAGTKIALDDPLVSPGNCKEKEWWRYASPSKGFMFMYGAEEVFAPEIAALIEVLKQADSYVEVREEVGGIHAWPVATLFLSSTREERQKGLKNIVHTLKERL
jgi:acetyl esterase/lipase